MSRVKPKDLIPPDAGIDLPIRALAYARPLEFSEREGFVNFAAAGAPGEHLIDLFPGIYQGPASEPQLLYRQPQLTYAEDHPGNKIPALHFKFDVK